MIQRFGSAANLNIHLHCLVLDGVYERSANGPRFHEARTPTSEQLRDLLERILTRIVKLLTRQGDLIEEAGMRCLGEIDAAQRLRRSGERATDSPSLAFHSCCPHFSLPLNYEPDRSHVFDGDMLMCADHTAIFRLADGRCVDGPCAGAQLTPIAIATDAGDVRIV